MRLGAISTLSIRIHGASVWAMRMAAFLAITAHLPAFAGTNAWTTIGPQGGYINEMNFHPTQSNTAYLLGAGLYKTTNSGQRWELVRDDFYDGADVAVDPSNGDRIAIVDGNSVRISTDGGSTFTNSGGFESGTTFEQIEFSSDGTALYVAGNERVYRSSDKGLTWARRTDLPGTAVQGRVAQLRVDPKQPETLIWFGYPAGLFVSHDGGGTWQPAVKPSDSISQLTFATVGSTRLWAATVDGAFSTADYGVTWTRSNLHDSIDSIAVHPTTPSTVYAGTVFSGVVRSTNAGLTWTNITADARPGRLAAIAVSPVNPAQLFIAGHERIYGSGDGGTTWSSRSEGFLAATISDLSSLGSSGEMYVSLHNGGIHRLDGNGSVTSLDQEALRAFFSNPFTMSFDSVLAQPITAGRVFASIQNVGVLRSTNGGTSWSLVPAAAFDSHSVFSFADSSVNKEVVVANVLTGLYRSTDGGLNWNSTTGLPAAVQIRDVALGSTRGYVGLMAAPAPDGSVTGRGVYRSNDLGATWQPANAGIESLLVTSIAIDATNDQRVVIGTDKGLYKSVDAGVTWTALPWVTTSGVTYLVAMDPTRPQTIYAAFAGRVGRSVDDGQTWETLRSPDQLPQWVPRTLDVNPAGPNTLLIGENGIRSLSIAPDLVLDTPTPATATGIIQRSNAPFTIRNAGTYHATGVRIQVQLPTQASEATGRVWGDSTGTCVAAGTVVTCTLDVLRAGITANIDIQMALMSVGEHVVSASVTGDQPDPHPTNNSATHTIRIYPPASLSAPQPAPASGGGGGGGGTFTPLLLLLGALLVLTRERILPRPHRLIRNGS